MRGSPPLHLLLLALLLGLIAIPLTRLTLASPATISVHSPAAHGQGDAKLVKTRIRVRYAHVPSSLSLKIDGKDLLTSAVVPHSSSLETEVPLSVAGDGVELALSAQWPAGTPDTALTVDLDPDGLDQRSETRWSEGPALSEILDFKW